MVLGMLQALFWYINNTHPALTREGVDVYPEIGDAYILPSSDQDITMQKMGLSAMCTLFTSEPAGDTNTVKRARAASAFSLQDKHSKEKKAGLQPHLFAIAKQRPGSQEFFNIKGKPSLHLIILKQIVEWAEQFIARYDNRYSSVFKVSLVHTTT